MQQVEVKKTELIEVIKKNRKEHRDVFLAAQEKYKAAVIEALEARLADARAGKRVRHSIALEAPQDHTREYDRVAAMLEMSVSDTITLSAHEFESYVLDRWPWASQFASNTQSYGVSSKYDVSEPEQ